LSDIKQIVHTTSGADSKPAKEQRETVNDVKKREKTGKNWEKGSLQRKGQI